MMKRTRRSLKSKGFRGQVMIRRYSGRWGGDGGEEKFRGMMLVDSEADFVRSEEGTEGEVEGRGSVEQGSGEFTTAAGVPEDEA
ncbi:hypothetical protein F2Q68_00026287 [Brassica cretica]|uniref:Uncharacterized protein n=1 Tax=Brassica cretica TaxID=69181 RepID=A0A8S9IIK2_BRACR|nr:hypothetical protein F2Q68_00026287 [Brassica cretica]